MIYSDNQGATPSFRAITIKQQNFLNMPARVLTNRARHVKISSGMPLAAPPLRAVASFTGEREFLRPLLRGAVHSGKRKDVGNFSVFRSAARGPDHNGQPLGIRVLIFIMTGLPTNSAATANQSMSANRIIPLMNIYDEWMRLSINFQAFSLCCLDFLHWRFRDFTATMAARSRTRSPIGPRHSRTR